MKGWLITVFPLLYSTTAFCSSCNFSLPYRGLGCNLDLSYGSLSNIRKLLNNSDKFVALTFDNGPSNSRVSTVISILESYKAKAAFFLLSETYK